MVVLSAAVVTKNGRVLVARQFVEMTRIRIEGLMAAFPKLLGGGSKQHTFIETESVRYVYQPLEQLYLVLVTNKASNIVQDLDTLRLLSKVVPDVCGGSTEERVQDKCFDLVFAFDEAINSGGYREAITLGQIRTNMEMDSHEEKLHQMIQKTKMENAKEESARQAKIMRERAKEQRALGGGGMSGMGGGGIGSDGMGGGGGGGMGSNAGGFGPPVIPSESNYGMPEPPVPEAAAPRGGNPVKGMSIGGLGKKQNLMDALVAEDNLAPVPGRLPAAGGGGPGGGAAEGAPPPPAAPALAHPLNFVAEERLTAQLSREGAVETVDLRGTLTVTALQEAASRSRVLLKVDESGKFTYQPHPKVDRAAFDGGRALAMKDPAKGFPLERALGLLRWSAAGAMGGGAGLKVPLSINCWPEEEGRGAMAVSIEYSLERPDMRLHDVVVTVPLGTAEQPTIQDVDGNVRHDAREGTLSWLVDLIDSSNRTGSLEFTVPCRDPDAFFPITVAFTSSDLYCNCEVLQITTVEGDTPVQFGLTKQLATDEYQVA